MLLARGELIRAEAIFARYQKIYAEANDVADKIIGPHMLESEPQNDLQWTFHGQKFARIHYLGHVVNRFDAFLLTPLRERIKQAEADYRAVCAEQNRKPDADILPGK